MRYTFILGAAMALLFCGSARAAETSGYAVNVLVDDAPRAEYHRDGTVYVEAIRGKEFGIRLTNPMPYRVAVALSVDGLNTIDARHTDAWSAKKWVLEPYESTVISGWQVNQQSARKFFFTGETRSYGASLGKTQNLGVIEAVFYAERRRPVVRRYQPSDIAPGGTSGGSADAQGESAPVPAPPRSAPSQKSQAEGALSDDYAATGMGHRTRHDIEWVDLDLDPTPVASARIRYEFHAQLVKLGVISDGPAPLERRERARGFGGYCPE